MKFLFLFLFLFFLESWFFDTPIDFVEIPTSVVFQAKLVLYCFHTHYVLLISLNVSKCC
jgi:hypothetical protein